MSVLDSNLLPGKLEPEWRDEFLFEQFPRISVQHVAELTIVVHLPPAVTTPFASSHVDKEVPLLLVVVDLLVGAIRIAGVRWEGVALALLDERSVGPNPRLIVVQVLQRVLLLMLPLHMLLLIANRVPPDIQKTIGPSTTPDEEGAEVESAAVLRDDHVDGRSLAVAG